MFSRSSPTKTSARKRSSSPRKSVERKIKEITGYSCTLYKHYLVFFGGLCDEMTRGDTLVYNIKEERMVQARNLNPSYPRYGHSACLYEPENMIILLGGHPGENIRSTVQDDDNAVMRLREGGDGLSWHLSIDLQGPQMSSPICGIYEKKLYTCQSGMENGNFGLLRSFDLEEESWQDLQTSSGNLRLQTPCHNAIWVQNRLYLFAENVDEKPRAKPRDGAFIEDVYVLDLSQKSPEWERVSFSGKAPGIMVHISITEVNGVVYIFGSSYVDEELKSVLWAYETNEEKWNKIQDIGTLTARPNQRALIYEGQLLMIDWDYLNQEVQLQFQNLSDINYASPSPSGSKDLCKDQAENIIQDMKNLYDARLFPDVIFEVEGEEVPAHKSLLAYRSNYFMKMFTSGMSESHSSKIPIPHMKSHIFKAILQYIYCNEVELDEQLALDLIPTVDEYVMKGLKGLCEKYLCKQLRKDNVVDMLIVADRHEIEELKKACFKFILKNLGNIDENEEMMKLSKSLFIELLKFNTSGSQKKNNTKSEKKEEEKSNYDDRRPSPKMATTGFGFGYGAPAGKKSVSKKKTPAKKLPSSEESISD